MGFYDKHILPKLLNTAMKSPDMREIRQQMVPLATGQVLEVGIGSGLNLPFYQKGVKVTGVDPSTELQVYARQVAQRSAVEVDFLSISGEDIPADNNSFDSAVITWTLCTIPNPHKALEEIRRVLKPGGKMIFSEHGMAPDASVAKWQARINPVWKRLAGGCNLNRKISEMIGGAGFQFDALNEGYIPGPKVAAYNYRGIAKTI